ncbi:MAG: lipoate--protein ligase family protein [Planctomycetota bacterium]|jgi:lipoate-protein ligase A
MRTRWRYIEDDGSSASFGLAADEYIARKVCASTSTSTSTFTHVVRLYTYKDASVMLGRNQDVESEINLPCCEELGININRRPTGGGAIVMGQGQLGVAIAGPVTGRSVLLDSKTTFSPFTRAIIVGLSLLGIKSEFRPKNDIYIKDGKIAGLATYTLDDNGTSAALYHASILADMDEDLMLRLLKKPGKKNAGENTGNNHGAITTASSELGRRVGTSELRDSIKRGIEKVLDAELVPEPFSQAELGEIKKLEQVKYISDSWIYYGKEQP